MGRNNLGLTGRRLATSAEKRKWSREGITKRERRLMLAQELVAKEPPKKIRDGNPFLLLVVFPVAMTGVVVMLREDLRSELAQMGRVLGRVGDEEPK